MRLRRKNRFTAEVSTSSLNDIMFFLLLFFLIVSTMINPSVIKLMLPNSKPSEQVPPKQSVTVSVNKDLQYFIGNKPVSFNDLEAAISSEVTRLNNPTVILRVDNSLKVQDLVDILQIGDRLKVKMILATKATNK
jgi:biopolymer transport protein ExbD